MIDTPEAAVRLARAIVSDIVLYNEDRIVEGIQKDSLFDLLATEINDGLELYRSRVSPQMFESSNFYNRALIDTLIATKAHIESKIW